MTRGEAVNWIINISADIGKAEHRELWHYEQALSEIREMLESEPERKKGKWIWDDEMGVFLCSSCKNGWKDQPTLMGKPLFEWCPVCGAEMRGKEDEAN